MTFRRAPSAIVGTSALLLLLAPLVVAGWMSFAPGQLLELPMDNWSLRWFRRLLDDARWRECIANSLEVAIVAAVLACVGGTSLALAVRNGNFRGKHLLCAAALAPLFTPPVVLGMGLLPLMHALGLTDSRLDLALAHSLIGLPIVFLMVRAALGDVGTDLENAARGLGAGPFAVFRRVTWPLIRGTVGAAALFTFIISFNEFTLALFLTGPESETLPRVLWPELRYSLSPLVAAASTLSVAVTLLALGFALGLRSLLNCLGLGRLPSVDRDRRPIIRPTNETNFLDRNAMSS